MYSPMTMPLESNEMTDYGHVINRQQYKLNQSSWFHFQINTHLYIYSTEPLHSYPSKTHLFHILNNINNINKIFDLYNW